MGATLRIHSLISCQSEVRTTYLKVTFKGVIQGHMLGETGASLGFTEGISGK